MVIVGVPKETVAGESRVALVPELVPQLSKAGFQVAVEPQAGLAAGFVDSAYQEKGACLEGEVFHLADVLLKVQPPSLEEAGRLKEGATLIGFLPPQSQGPLLEALKARKIAAYAMERMPRISRAQAMDALSAMSTVAGYKAVLLAANRLAKFFPLLMTAAGTVTPARVLILGAGVAGLQAIATARRLGAVVAAYDPRPVVREQVESLGARFVDLGLETTSAEDKGGYARAQTEDFYQRQRQELQAHVTGADVVITTALVPGQRAPLLITADMIGHMQPGSVIVDLAAEQGGNCEGTEPGQETCTKGVVILGPLNLASSLPYHASIMFARTVVNYLLYLHRDGQWNLDRQDEMVSGPLLT